MIRRRSLTCGLALALCAWAAATAADSPSSPHCDVTASNGTYRVMRLLQVVCVRARAIETAFGALFDGRSLEIRIELASADDPGYPRAAMSAYDPARKTIYFRRGAAATILDGDYHWALAYWPYYTSDIARDEYPEIAIVDEALWNAHLQQAAYDRGMNWPSDDCGVIDIARRLGCEMLVTASAELARSASRPLFNANRVDQLWPENLREFERRAWTRDGRQYREVRRYGGLLLLEPLIREFGAPRVFAYLARTPFRIQDDNVRLSALRYQAQARSALAE